MSSGKEGDVAEGRDVSRKATIGVRDGRDVRGFWSGGSETCFLVSAVDVGLAR